MAELEREVSSLNEPGQSQIADQKSGIIPRLSLLMFLQYAPAGAVLPLYSLRLQELQFTPIEIGWASATQALAGLSAPLLAGQVADRWWPAERCLAVYAFLAAGLLWLLAGLEAPVPVFWISLTFWTFLTPALTLGNSLSFAHLRTPQRDFGRVRLWGTVGWVVAAWLLGYWVRQVGHIEDIFRLGAILSLLLAVYALTLPSTPPQPRAGARFAPLAALRLLRIRSFAVYSFVYLGWCVTVPFVGQMNSLLLTKLGVPLPWLSPTLTLAQFSEVTSLALLPMLLIRLGLRGTMLLGLAAWSAEFIIMTLGEPTWLVIASLIGHGTCVCCFLVAGQVFVQSLAQDDIRASAQALFTFIGGAGMLTGNLLVGWVRHHFDGAFGPTYGVAAVLCLLLLATFAAGFWEE